MPSDRNILAMVYDASREKLVLFGGYSTTILGDTWEWTASSGVWEQRTTTVAPPPRYGHAMTYDPVRQRVLLFGGNDGNFRQDIWEWDGTAWTELTPVGTSPKARQHPGFVYDVSRSRALLVGGLGAGGFAPMDAWEWDGDARSWTVRPAASAKPGGREGHGFAYDPVRKVAVLFGGHIESVGYASDTWEWDGATGTWTEKAPAGGAPRARAYTAMVYDATLARMVLVDGYVDSTTLDEVWEWNGASSTWSSQGSAAPMPSRYFHAMVFDSGRGKVMVFGGASSATTDLNDLWERGK